MGLHRVGYDLDLPAGWDVNNGHEFPFAFALAVQAVGIRPPYIKPRRPQQNGKVERSHRIDQEDFGGRRRFDDFDSAAVGRRDWERHYNHERFSLALQARTPAEKLAALMPATAVLTPCRSAVKLRVGPGSIWTRPNTGYLSLDGSGVRA